MQYVFQLATAGLLLYTAIFCGGVMATATQEVRSADYCADPSLVIPFVQGFNPKENAYILASVVKYTNRNAVTPDNGFIYQGETFLAWGVQQNFTSPLYRLFNPTTQDYLSIASDSGVPSIPGFIFNDILGYVYFTQVCSSVPLLGASNPSAGSHYYTTDANVHSQLISLSGWSDAGTAGYVLPLSFTY